MNKPALPPLSEEAKSLKKGIYEHYKGQQYHLLTIARHSETLEEMVVYQALYGEQGVWVRPLKMFIETIEVDGRKMPRFKHIK